MAKKTQNKEATRLTNLELRAFRFTEQYDMMIFDLFKANVIGQTTAESLLGYKIPAYLDAPPDVVPQTVVGGIPGPVGPVGPAGPPGQAGPPGPSGVTPAISATASASVSATAAPSVNVVVTGATATPQLNFAFQIPRGQDGTPGANGLNGAPGIPNYVAETYADYQNILQGAKPGEGILYLGDDQNTIPTLRTGDVVLVGNGGYTWVAGSFRGPAGIDGAPGIDGKDGTAVSIIGKFDDPSDLPAIGNAGDAYLINGNLWVWDGTAFINVGNIQGPKGDKGDKGDTGADGAAGANGPEGPKGPRGSIWWVTQDEITNGAVITLIPQTNFTPLVGDFVLSINANGNGEYGILSAVNGTTYTVNGSYGSLIGPQGEQGVQGQQGIPGPQGIPGHGIVFRGVINAYSQLPSSPAVGDSYYLDGMLYIAVQDGSSIVFQPEGQGVAFRGPQGQQGVQGLPGPQGQQGASTYYYVNNNSSAVTLPRVFDNNGVRQYDGAIIVNTSGLIPLSSVNSFNIRVYAENNTGQSSSYTTFTVRPGSLVVYYTTNVPPSDSTYVNTWNIPQQIIGLQQPIVPISSVGDVNSYATYNINGNLLGLILANAGVTVGSSTFVNGDIISVTTSPVKRGNIAGPAGPSGASIYAFTGAGPNNISIGKPSTASPTSTALSTALVLNTSPTDAMGVQYQNSAGVITVYNLAPSSLMTFNADTTNDYWIPGATIDVVSKAYVDNSVIGGASVSTAPSSMTLNFNHPSGSQSFTTALPVATTLAAGLMSAADRTKMNNVVTVDSGGNLSTSVSNININESITTPDGILLKSPNSDKILLVADSTNDSGDYPFLYLATPTSGYDYTKSPMVFSRDGYIMPTGITSTSVFTGLVQDDLAIKHVKSPEEPGDAATKAYVDALAAKIKAAGVSITWP